jgi:SAM-dependent methyltransferase
MEFKCSFCKTTEWDEMETFFCCKTCSTKLRNKKKKMRVLNVGSGNRPMPNDGLINTLKQTFDVCQPFMYYNTYANIDKDDGKYNIDLDDLKAKPLPFEDNSFDAIIMWHVFEHIDDVITLMEELYRVAKDDTVLYIACPWWQHAWAVGDIDHKRFINELTFNWFSKKFYEIQHKDSPCTPCRVRCNWEYDPSTNIYDHDKTGKANIYLALTANKRRDIFE